MTQETFNFSFVSVQIFFPFLHSFISFVRLPYADHSYCFFFTFARKKMLRLQTQQNTRYLVFAAAAAAVVVVVPVYVFLIRFLFIVVVVISSGGSKEEKKNIHEKYYACILRLLFNWCVYKQRSAESNSFWINVCVCVFLFKLNTRTSC